MMSAFGSFTPGFVAASFGSFHLVMVPRKIPAMVAPSSLSCVLPRAGRFQVSTTAPITVGRWSTTPCAAFIWSCVIGPSVAPKSTVFSVYCLIPPPEPID